MENSSLLPTLSIYKDFKSLLDFKGTAGTQFPARRLQGILHLQVILGASAHRPGTRRKNHRRIRRVGAGILWLKPFDGLLQIHGVRLWRQTFGAVHACGHLPCHGAIRVIRNRDAANY